jgi:hypothetical protein
MHHIELFGRKEFFRRFETTDPRRDVAHGGQGGVGRVRHRDELNAGTAHNRAGMVLRMAACADEGDS